MHYLTSEEIAQNGKILALSDKIDIVFRFLMAMRTLDEWERAWLPAPIPEC